MGGKFHQVMTYLRNFEREIQNKKEDFGGRSRAPLLSAKQSPDCLDGVVVEVRSYRFGTSLSLGPADLV